MESASRISLTVFAPNGGRTQVEGEFELSIGTAESCDVVLVGEGVDRQHARLSLREGKFWVTDLASDTGTFINGVRITMFNDIGEITADDRVTLGGYLLCLGDRVSPPPEKKRSGLWARLVGR